MVDSFGYEVMTLSELAAALMTMGRKHPELKNRPVWVDNCPPLKWPVKFVALPKGDPTRGVALLVERGGN